MLFIADGSYMEMSSISPTMMSATTSLSMAKAAMSLGSCLPRSWLATFHWSNAARLPHSYSVLDQPSWELSEEQDDQMLTGFPQVQTFSGISTEKSSIKLNMKKVSSAQSAWLNTSQRMRSFPYHVMYVISSMLPALKIGWNKTILAPYAKKRSRWTTWRVRGNADTAKWRRQNQLFPINNPSQNHHHSCKNNEYRLNTLY